jgi:hypothetical protein
MALGNTETKSVSKRQVAVEAEQIEGRIVFSVCNTGTVNYVRRPALIDNAHPGQIGIPDLNTSVDIAI